MVKKKIFVIGNGAKEFALAKKLSEKYEVYINSLSCAVDDFATKVDIRDNNVSELLEFAMETGIDMTIPVSIEAIKNNIVGRFTENNQTIFGPSSQAGKIVFDKAIAKKIFYKLHIPTPKFGIFEKQSMVLDYIKNLKTPFVLKTNDANSAAVFTSYNCAKNIVEASFIEKDKKIIIEDYIYGTPFSFYAITDGYKALPFGSSINYRYSLEGDGGQITSGMGACAPNYKLSFENEYYLMDNVIYPLLDYLEIEGNSYVGILGISGILTEDNKLCILGIQSFMQDCDALAILENVSEDIYNLFESCVIGSFSDEFESIAQNNCYSTTLVLTNKNRENKENAILGIDNLDETTKFILYPDVTKNRYLEYEAPYGQVISITSSSNVLSRSIRNVYEEAEEIKFAGKHFRKDIH